MKITKIDILHCKTKLKGGVWRPIVIRVYTDSGIFGDGEAALAYGEAQFAAVGILKNFAKLVIGMDPLDHEIIWDKLYRSTFWGQNGGPVINAGISAIDIALWDIKGKFFQVPVYKLLGGKRRDSLRTYASQLQFGWQIVERGAMRTPEDYACQARKAVAEGYDAVKVDFFQIHPEQGKSFTDLDRLGLLRPEYLHMIEARVKAVRDAVGPDVDIIVENHSATDAQSALQIARTIEKYGIFYYEEPTTPTPQLCASLQGQIRIPVAHGERIYTRWQYAPYFQQNALQVIQPDVGTCGGITEIKKICDMAYVYDVGVQVHACGSPLCTAAALQLECAIPNFVIHEHHTYGTSPYNRELCKYDYQPEQGQYVVPDLPGIGNEISEIAYKNADIFTVE